jgi:hypothetical protein
MNGKLFAAILATAALALPACKTTDSTAMTKSTENAERQKVGSTYDPRIVEDKVYIDYVQRLALRRGVYVKWVNKPTKRIVDDKSDQ